MSDAYSDKLEKCVHSVVLLCSICTKFVPNKEHSRTALTFCFHLKKTAAESYQLLREAYRKHAPSQDMCEQWFRRFKSGVLEIADNKHGNPPKYSKMWSCKHRSTKMIHKHKCSNTRRMHRFPRTTSKLLRTTGPINHLL